MINEEEARSLSVYQSRVRRKDCIVDGINVSEILNLLEGEQDCHCVTNARLVGASGAAHEFDIMARKGFELINVSIIQSRNSILDSPVAEDESSEQITVEAVKLGLKSMDCGANLTILIRLSSYLSRESVDDHEDGEDEIMNRFNIKVIDAPDIPTATRKMRELLASMDFISACNVGN